MIYIIKGMRGQDIFMIHVVDGIEAINQDHQGRVLGIKESEGIVFAGLDPVATDHLCARYMFSNVSLKEAMDDKLISVSVTTNSPVSDQLKKIPYSLSLKP